MALVWVFDEIAEAFFRWPMLGDFLASESLRLGIAAAACVISWIIVRCCSPGWSLWLAGGYDRDETPHTTQET
jgi:hypothetical protein